jgi:7-cyano-7-deazaguanine synthase
MRKGVVVSLSGGMDSATLLGLYYDKGYRIYPVLFDYGSKHGEYEQAAAFKLCGYYGIPFDGVRVVKLPFIQDLYSSHLLKDGGEIPEGHYSAPTMAVTVVPARNLVFASILAGYAWSIGEEIVALGIHTGDHFVYPDCRPDFFYYMNQAVISGTDKRVYLEAPLMNHNKTSILRMGFSFKKPVPYEFTRTCYKDQPLSCGKCGSCTERLEAFAAIGKKDPIQYLED